MIKMEHPMIQRDSASMGYLPIAPILGDAEGILRIS